MGHDVIRDGIELVNIQAVGHYLIQICHITIELKVAGHLARERLVQAVKLYLGEDDDRDCLIQVCQTVNDFLTQAGDDIGTILIAAGCMAGSLVWLGYGIVLIMTRSWVSAWTGQFLVPIWACFVGWTRSESAALFPIEFKSETRL